MGSDVAGLFHLVQREAVLGSQEGGVGVGETEAALQRVDRLRGGWRAAEGIGEKYFHGVRCSLTRITVHRPRAGFVHRPYRPGRFRP
ncbi:hypothetical protein D9M68_982360 [compost metagenome]